MSTPALPRCGIHAISPRPGILLLVALAGLLSVPACRGPKGDDGEDGTSPTIPEDGFQFIIENATIQGDRHAEIKFRIQDAEGQPLKLSDLDRDPRFVIGWIDRDAASGHSRYQSYVVNVRDGAPYNVGGMPTPPALMSATQAGFDSGGTFTSLGNGAYRYRSNAVLPEGYDRDATHTVAGTASREDEKFILNPEFHWVPGGGSPDPRQTVETAACNNCHDPLEAHGSVRRETALCVVCHTDQTIDPESGHTVDFKVMVHKIHRGSSLTNLPYRIIGNNQSVHDYSDVHFPQEIQNCTKCHTGADADNWKSRPGRAACGSCHDNVNFATGENHNGIVQPDDTQCSTCHPSTMEFEFDRSVPGAHVIPYESSANPHLTVAITDVQNMMPGMQPRVRFTLTNNVGPVDIVSLGRVAIVFAGPTGDYTQLLNNGRFTIRGGGARPTLTPNGIGDYTYAPDAYVIPMSATGSWSVGMEARTNAIPVGSRTISFGSNNPVVHIDLTNGNLGGGSPVPRRLTVDQARCNVCHRDVIAHGNNRTDTTYCILCHNKWGTDEAQRPGVNPTTNPPETIDFKMMIHRIHTGDDLTGAYTVYGNGMSVHDFTEIRFPGDRRNCEKCHIPGTYLLPGPATAQATVVHIGGTPVPQVNAVRPPVTAACTGCHDSPDTFTHARLNSIVNSPTDWVESCNVCHGEGSAFAVSEVHKR